MSLTKTWVLFEHDTGYMDEEILEKHISRAIAGKDMRVDLVAEFGVGDNQAPAPTATTTSRRKLIQAAYERISKLIQSRDLQKEKVAIRSKQELVSFALSMNPSIRELIEHRMAANRNRKRAKKAEAKIDTIHELAEKALCDTTDKNDLLRALEVIIKECGYDDSDITEI